ncbi:alpha/beta fold hydrolase [Accumulibacter sp.]|uniref:alpha/beta fold hydrolase n=1 Tax=Accumulibacter sp. TaxID=2053492 RepID=UPI00257CBE62|nr:alpha/beta fold hydrolase [Accumulibacter sp.]
MHGATHDRDAWQQVARGLTAAGCAVLVPDLPAHGLSSGPALRSVEVLADWVPALLDVAGVREAILVGHSMGSLVTLECAARYPQRVSGLVLLGTSAPMLMLDTLIARAEANPDSAIRMMNEKPQAVVKMILKFLAVSTVSSPRRNVLDQ